MPVQALLSYFRRGPAIEGMRLERLLEGQLTALDESFEPLTFRHRSPAADAGRDRRTEPRFRIDTECEVSVIVQEDLEPIRGVVRDVSRAGLGVVLSAPLSEGAEVMVRFGTVVIFGHVAFAGRDGHDDNAPFYAGISLRHVFEVRQNDTPAQDPTIVRKL